MKGGGRSAEGPDPGGLLISDADRDQISAVLSRHMEDGRLTVDELDQRLGQLLECRTRGQAAAVLVGLPALAEPEHAGRFHIGHSHDDAGPELPSWMAPDGQLQRPSSTAATRRAPAAREETAAVRATPAVPDGRQAAAQRPAGAPAAATEQHSPTAQSKRAQEKAARKQAQLRQDENAIGHLFQARRRELGAELESATAAGKHKQADRAGERLQEAKDAAAAARQAVAAGDRAEMQRQLERLRNA